MKTSLEHSWLIILTIVALICLGLIFSYLQELKLYNQRLEAFNETKNLKINQFIGGYYFKTDYFCIYKKGLSTEDIEKYINHESCHSQITNDYKHFCNGDNITSWNN